MSNYLERGIVDAFAANATLNTLLSGRVYPLRLPDTARTFPAVVYQIVDRPLESTQEGPEGASFARVQFRFYANTYQGVVDLRNAFASAYHATKPAAFGSPAVYLHGWFIDSESDDWNSALDQSGFDLWSKRLDVLVHVKNG